MPGIKLGLSYSQQAVWSFELTLPTKSRVLKDPISLWNNGPDAYQVWSGSLQFLSRFLPGALQYLSRLITTSVAINEQPTEKTYQSTSHTTTINTDPHRISLSFKRDPLPYRGLSKDPWQRHTTFRCQREKRSIFLKTQIKVLKAIRPIWKWLGKSHFHQQNCGFGG